VSDALHFEKWESCEVLGLDRDDAGRRLARWPDGLPLATQRPSVRSRQLPKASAEPLVHAASSGVANEAWQAGSQAITLPGVPA